MKMSGIYNWTESYPINMEVRDANKTIYRYKSLLMQKIDVGSITYKMALIASICSLVYLFAKLKCKMRLQIVRNWNAHMFFSDGRFYNCFNLKTILNSFSLLYMTLVSCSGGCHPLHPSLPLFHGSKMLTRVELTCHVVKYNYNTKFQSGCSSNIDYFDIYL